MDQREGVREALARFESGETDFEEFTDPRGARTFMIRDPEDPRFFRMEAENENHQFAVTMTGMRFPPSDSRPSELPAHLPFIPGSSIVIMIMPATGSTVVRWDDPSEPPELFARIEEESLDAGWEEIKGPSPEVQGLERAFFSKGNLRRTLTLFSEEEERSVILTDEPEDKANPS